MANTGSLRFGTAEILSGSKLDFSRISDGASTLGVSGADPTVVTSAVAAAAAPPRGVAIDSRTGEATKTAFELFKHTDPEMAKQWHLDRLGNLDAVWADYTGKGVHVGVYDSGIQKAHEDLNDNYDASREITINGHVKDGGYRPASGPHGTAVAGLIGAEHNGIGVVGVAYGSSLTGVNIFDPYDLGDNSAEVFVNGGAEFYNAMRAGNTFDVVNHSWGPSPYDLSTDSSRSNPNTFASQLTETFGYVADTGRHGLGTVSVMAAGNDPADGIMASVNSSRYVTAVGAYREVDGSSSQYESGGYHMLVSAPSNDYSNLGGTGQVTTDLMGRDGYNFTARPGANTNYTDAFGGTSGATPIVTGVVSLMLDANDQLGWRDVRDILAASAKMPVAFDTGPTSILSTDKGDRFESNNSIYRIAGQEGDWNGGGYHYSRDYGYGGVDAYNAVRMAEVWSLFGAAKTSANEASFSTGTIDLDLDVAGLNKTFGEYRSTLQNDFVGSATGQTFQISGANVDIEHVDMTLTWSNTQPKPDPIPGVPEGEIILGNAGSSLRLKLTAPDGTTAFVDAFGDTSSATERTFTFGFANFRGVDANGTWKVEFEFPDKQSGTMKDMKLDLYGSAPTADDVFTYTHEFFAMKAIAGEADRGVLADTDGGIDWINAAAMAEDVKLSLVAGQSTSFDGVQAFTIAKGSLIENAVTGDGNDVLVGNALANHLLGMRGNDKLLGGAGVDTLEGGTGKDWLNGETGNDVLIGGAGKDMFVFDNLKTSGRDTISDFGADDLILTTRAIRDGNGDGIINAGANHLFNLDSSSKGDAMVLQGNVTALEYDGKTVLDGVTYYVYSTLHSGVGLADANFG